MPSNEAANWPEALASPARIATDAGQPGEVRCEALRLLATAANDEELPGGTRDQTLCILAETAGEEHQGEEIREEAFIGLRPIIRLIAAQVAKSFSGQPAQDLLQEAESCIWERLPRFRAGRFQGWCYTVLRHLILSWLRRRKPGLTAQPVTVAQEEGEHGETLATPWVDITEQIAAQIATIRQVFPLQAVGAVLLLHERLWLGQVLADSYAPEDGRTVGDQTLGEIVEIVAFWETADAARLLPPRETPLGWAWQQIREQTQDRIQDAVPELVADLLGASRVNWNQWVCRGRTRLVRQLGSTAARQLFPHWPAGIFQRAAGETAP